MLQRLLVIAALAHARRGGDFTGVNFGIRGEDFVLLAAETGHRKGPLQYAADGRAIRRVDEGAVLSCVGHQGRGRRPRGVFEGVADRVPPGRREKVPSKKRSRTSCGARSPIGGARTATRRSCGPCSGPWMTRALL